jgi:hypothetical protein
VTEPMTRTDVAESHELRGRVGAGGPTLDLTTGSGSIHVSSIPPRSSHLVR